MINSNSLTVDTKGICISMLLSLILVVFIASPSHSQEDDDLAKKTQNPLSNLISLPFQNNINFGIGPDDEIQNVLNIQPVIPISLNKDWNLITRTIIPLRHGCLRQNLVNLFGVWVAHYFYQRQPMKHLERVSGHLVHQLYF